MWRGETNPSPIQILVNYWELRSINGVNGSNTTLHSRLDELMRNGVTRLATFVPWQAVESDISHILPRFLQAVAERRMSVSLILTPEVGVYFPQSGLPKDLTSKAEHLAKHPGQEPVNVVLPPQVFALPSLLSPEILRRFHHFLTRIDSMLADLQRVQPHLLDHVSAVLTGSFWKYYRSPRASAYEAFGGPAGESSAVATVSLRQRMDQFYSQREFLGAQAHSAAAAASQAARWRGRPLEEINRRWFQQFSEDLFRNRCRQFLKRKAAQLNVHSIELFTPEADPGFVYSQVLQTISGRRGDLGRLASLIDEYAMRASACPPEQGSGVGGDLSAPPIVHFTGLGAFRSLTDSEKQFLILKALLQMGGRGGGVLIDEDEWFSLSASFRNRAESLSRSIAQQELRLRSRVLHWVPHLWSSPGPLWDVLHAQLHSEARLVASLELGVHDEDAEVLFVDSQHVLTQDQVRQLLDWSRSGRTLVLPRSPLWTDSARLEVAKARQGVRAASIEMGFRYDVTPLGMGRMVLFDPPEVAPGASAAEVTNLWKGFVQAVLALTGMRAPCTIGDSRLSAVSLLRKDGNLGVFVLNSAPQMVTGDLIFPSEVTVSDLTQALAGSRARSTDSAAPACRFSLEVPPSGILPIAVDGVGEQVEERRLASLTSELLEEGLEMAARSELPGFEQFDSGAPAWN